MKKEAIVKELIKTAKRLIAEDSVFWKSDWKNGFALYKYLYIDDLSVSLCYRELMKQQKYLEKLLEEFGFVILNEAYIRFNGRQLIIKMDVPMNSDIVKEKVLKDLKSKNIKESKSENF